MCKHNCKEENKFSQINKRARGVGRRPPSLPAVEAASVRRPSSTRTSPPPPPTPPPRPPSSPPKCSLGLGGLDELVWASRLAEAYVRMRGETWSGPCYLLGPSMSTCSPVACGPMAMKAWTIHDRACAFLGPTLHPFSLFWHIFDISIRNLLPFYCDLSLGRYFVQLG